MATKRRVVDGDNDGWAQLPADLLLFVAEHLETPLDLHRLRATCKSWRSSLATFPSNPHLASILLPFVGKPKSDNTTYEFVDGAMMYSLKTVHLAKPNRASPDGNSSDSSPNAFLLEVLEESPEDALHVGGPDMRRACPSGSWNRLDFNMSLLCEYYYMDVMGGVQFDVYGRRLDIPIKKVVVTRSKSLISQDYVALAICGEDRMLGVFRSGEKTWNVIGNGQFGFDDVIVHKGEFYAVHGTGKMLKIDPFSLATYIVSFSIGDVGAQKALGRRLLGTMLCKKSSWLSQIGDGGGEKTIVDSVPGHDGGKKTLVEACGDLLLVDTYARNVRECEDNPVKMYKLNEEEHEWVELRSFQDRVVFVFNEGSFSVSNGELGEINNGNCIYFLSASMRRLRLCGTSNNSYRMLPSRRFHGKLSCLSGKR